MSEGDPHFALALAFRRGADLMASAAFGLAFALVTAFAFALAFTFAFAFAFAFPLAFARAAIICLKYARLPRLSWLASAPLQNTS